MAYEVPTLEPKRHQAGTTFRFDRTLPDFPASLWILAYSLRHQGSENAPIEVVATADGDTFEVNETATTTETWNAGEYLMVGYVTDIATATERHQVYRDTIQIDPYLGGIEPVEWRSYAQRMLALVEGVIAGSIARRDISYSINGHSVTAKTDADLLNARAYFMAEVNREKNGGRHRKILTTFKAPR